MSKKIVIILVLITSIILYKIFINPPANKEVRYKLSLIDKELKTQGYRRWYFLSSGKRSKWYNDFLKTVKNSQHLKGNAIDIIVFDIDGDWLFNEKDISILERINANVEKNHPRLTGAFGTYRKEFGIYFNMVHLDTRGKRVRYDQ